MRGRLERVELQRRLQELVDARHIDKRAHLPQQVLARVAHVLVLLVHVEHEIDQIGVYLLLIGVARRSVGRKARQLGEQQVGVGAHTRRLFIEARPYAEQHVDEYGPDVAFVEHGERFGETDHGLERDRLVHVVEAGHHGRDERGRVLLQLVATQTGHVAERAQAQATHLAALVHQLVEHELEERVAHAQRARVAHELGVEGEHGDTLTGVRHVEEAGQLLDNHGHAATEVRAHATRQRGHALHVCALVGEERPRLELIAEFVELVGERALEETLHGVDGDAARVDFTVLGVESAAHFLTTTFAVIAAAGGGGDGGNGSSVFLVVVGGGCKGHGVANGGRDADENGAEEALEVARQHVLGLDARHVDEQLVEYAVGDEGRDRRELDAALLLVGQRARPQLHNVVGDVVDQLAFLRQRLTDVDQVPDIFC